MTQLTVIPSCGQTFMQPHASPGFNAWGVFVAGEWVQIGGTPVDLSTNDALTQLVSQGACAPNSAPVDLAAAEPPSQDDHENITAAVPDQTPIEQGQALTQNILVGGVLLLVVAGAWFLLRPRKNRVAKFTGSSAGAVSRLSKITQEDNDA